MEEKGYEVSLGQLFQVAFKHWWIILIAVVLGATIAFAYVNLFVTPTYTTTAEVGVNNMNMSSYQDAIAGQTVAADSAKIIVGNVCLSRAAEKLNTAENVAKFGKTYTAESIARMINTAVSEATRYIEVKVTSTNAEETEAVCWAVVNAFRQVLEEEDLLNGAKGKIIDEPTTPTAPSSPNVTLTVVLGALIGIVLSFGTLLIVHFSKNALDGEDWIIETYKEKIPMLAVIPDAYSAERKYRKYGYKYKKYTGA